MKRPSLKHRLEYVGYRFLTAMAWFLPERFASWLGEGLGWTAAVLLRIRRRDVDRHLRLAFPAATPRWRRRVGRGCYRHFGREWIAMLRLAKMDARGVVAQTSVVGLDSLRRALERGRGVIVVTGHVGNWEIGGGAVTARGIPLDVVVFPQANPLVNEAWRGHRRRLGMGVVMKNEAAAGVLRALRRGRVVAILADQNARGSAFFVDYFGVPAATAKGPALFAVRSGAPVFLGTAFRRPGARPRYVVTLAEIAFERSGDPADDMLRLTESYTAALEEVVRRRPDQYLWQHRRWKTRPASDDGGELRSSDHVLRSGAGR